MVANGQLETPIATIELKFDVGEIKFVERFIVMSNLANPLIGLLFLQRNGTVIDMRQGVLNFPSFAMQQKEAKNSYPIITELLINSQEIILQPWKQSGIWIKSQMYKEHGVTGLLQPSQHTETIEELIFSPSIIYSKTTILLLFAAIPK